MPQKTAIAVEEYGVRDVSVKEAMGDVDIFMGVRRIKTGYRGHEHTVERPIARTLKEAQDTGADWFSPTLNCWVRGGYKPEKDYPENRGVPFLPPPADELPATK